MLAPTNGNGTRQAVTSGEYRAMQWPSTWANGCVEHIAAVDPGETTGVAILHRQRATRDTWIFVEVPYKTRLIHDTLLHVNLIIVEPFTVKSKDTPKANYTAIKVIGAVELTAQLQGIPTPILSPPHNVQGNGTAITEQWQRESHLWMPKMIHANDAARHLIHWLIFKAHEEAWRDQHAAIMKKRLSVEDRAT